MHETKLVETPVTEDKHAGMHGPTNVRLWLRMLSCTTVIEKRLRRRLVEHFGTTLPRFDALAALDRRPQGLSMGELSRMLLVSNGNVTAIVRQLQADGDVIVESLQHDARSSIVRLTERGSQRFAELAEAHHRWIGAMFAGVPEARQQELLDLLVLVKASINADPAE